MRKKLFTRILLVLIGITIIGTTICYFIFETDKPMMAFFIACCGFVLVINFSISLFLVRKNFK